MALVCLHFEVFPKMGRLSKVLFSSEDYLNCRAVCLHDLINTMYIDKVRTSKQCENVVLLLE